MGRISWKEGREIEWDISEFILRGDRVPVFQKEFTQRDKEQSVEPEENQR